MTLNEYKNYSIIWVFLQIDLYNPAFFMEWGKHNFIILFILSVFNFTQGQKHTFQLRQMICFYYSILAVES